MKRAMLAAAIMLCSTMAWAQNPKTVIKEALDGDYTKCCEKLSKLNDKSKSETPELCYLAEATCKSMAASSDNDNLNAYATFSKHYRSIGASAHLDKLMKDCHTSFETLKLHIEQTSSKIVFAKDDEKIYREYIHYAKAAEHSELATLKSSYEQRCYNNVCSSNTVAEYTRFLTLFPHSERVADVEERRLSLRYAEASTSSNERVMEEFIADYPTANQTAAIKQRLMEHRYARVTNSRKIDDMRWFAKEYPAFDRMAELQQLMADVEYETLGDNVESLRAFIANYPNAKQRVDAEKRCRKMEISNNPTMAGIIGYVRSYGYDRNYSTFMRLLAEANYKQGYTGYILTPDITKTTLVRFIGNKEPRSVDIGVGYMDLEGNIVIEPKYGVDEIWGCYGAYDMMMMTEFTPERQVAAICDHTQKWGAIDATGKEIVPLKYEDINIAEGRITAYIKQLPNEYVDIFTFLCDIFDYNGKLLKHNVSVEIMSSDMHYRDFFLADGSIKGKYLTPRYGITENSATMLLTRDGEEIELDVTLIQGVTDSIAQVSKSENGTTTTYFYDLDKREIIRPCEYDLVSEVREGRIAVKKNDLWGFIDEELNEVIPCKFSCSEAPFFTAGAAAVGNPNTGYNLIDTDGNYITGRYEEIKPYVNRDIAVGAPWLSANEMFAILPGVFYVRGADFAEIVDSNGKLISSAGDNTQITGTRVQYSTSDRWNSRTYVSKFFYSYLMH